MDSITSTPEPKPAAAPAPVPIYLNPVWIVSVMVFGLLVGGGVLLYMNRSTLPENKQQVTVPVSIMPTGTNEGVTITTAPVQAGGKAFPTLKSATPTGVPKPTQDLHHLPLGDNKYTTTGPKMGYVYICRAQNGSNAGAFKNGPWINTTAKTWDLTTKVTVDGSVAWPNASWKISENGANRILVTNGLPSHRTGIYPIQSTDDAYAYDRNPNSIQTQSLTITLPVNPVLLSSPDCIGGEVGIMLSGTPLFNSFDEAGRDADAHEVQDDCSGHPQVSGLYHYHGYSKCMGDSAKAGEHSALLGYALDGFGIFGLHGEQGEELTSNDLDECHGHTHMITWEGKQVSMYHYHLTHDFPYSVSCYRAKKAVNGPLGGAPSGGQQRQGPPPGGGMPPPPPGQ